MSDCCICYERFDNSKRCKFTCPSCDIDVCRTCIRKYLLNKNDEPHCMNCKNRWERDIYTTATLKIIYQS